MGLRQGAKTTGRFPGASDPEFVKRCGRFFLLQLSVQRPRILVTLGKHVPRLIAPLSLDLTEWGRYRTLRELDVAGVPVLEQVVFPTAEPLRVTTVALTHPSMRARNVHRRRYGDAEGNAAEIQMLQDALRLSPISKT
jgi:uracil-DNA glycosylase